MIETLAVLVVGICVGVVSAAACVPRIRVLPLVCSGVLSGLGAIGLIWSDAANLPLALGFVALAVVSSAAYGARLWTEEFGADSPGWGRMFLLELFRPGRLRKIRQAQQVGSA